MADDATPAEVIEVVGSTGMHGEAMQVKCRILDGNNKGRIITRNTVGPIREGDIVMLLEKEREAKKMSRRGKEWLKSIPAVSAVFRLNQVLARCTCEKMVRSFISAAPSARIITSLAEFLEKSSGLQREKKRQIRSEIIHGPHFCYGQARRGPAGPDWRDCSPVRIKRVKTCRSTFREPPGSAGNGAV